MRLGEGSDYHFPGTCAWFSARLDHRARLEIRQAMRGMVRTLEARFIWLWVLERTSSTALIEYVGDVAALPKRLPDLRSSVPEREVVVDRDGERADAVTLRVSMGGGVPLLGIGIVGLEHVATPVLFDAIERLGESIEEILVRAFERAKPRP